MAQLPEGCPQAGDRRMTLQNQPSQGKLQRGGNISKKNQPTNHITVLRQTVKRRDGWNINQVNKRFAAYCVKGW